MTNPTQPNRSGGALRPRVFAAVFYGALTFGVCATAGARQIAPPPDFAPFILDERVEREEYNMRLGPVLVDIVGTFGIEYDDNINTSENNEVSDLILQPGVSFGLNWQISETNELTANLGLEYWYYLDNSDLNRARNQVALSPETELSYRIMIGDVVFRVFDRIQFSFDTTDSVVIDPDTGAVEEQDPEIFSQYENTGGLQSNWFIGENFFRAQLSRTDVWSPDDEFEFVERTEYKAALNAERPLAANFTVGAGASYELLDFDLDVNNDGDVITAGPFFDWKITDVIGLYAGVAWNRWDFDEGATTDNFSDETSTNEVTWNVRLSHAVNEYYDHQLEWYRSQDVSTISNFNRLDGLRYSFSYLVMPRIRLDGSVAYEQNEDSGGLLNDDFDRWILGLGTEVRLGPRFTGELSYSYVDKDSDAQFRSYERNRVRLQFRYGF